jgi:hypothetical protein
MKPDEIRQCECGHEPPCEPRTFEDAGRDYFSGLEAARAYHLELFDRGHFPDMRRPRPGRYRVAPGYVSAGGVKYGQGRSAKPGVIVR